MVHISLLFTLHWQKQKTLYLIIYVYTFYYANTEIKTQKTLYFIMHVCMCVCVCVCVCMKYVKVLITQSYLTPCNPMDCSLPGSSVLGILQARALVDCHSLLQGIFLTWGLNWDLLHWRWILLPSMPPGKPIIYIIYVCVCVYVYIHRYICIYITM